MADHLFGRGRKSSAYLGDDRGHGTNGCARIVTAGRSAPAFRSLTEGEVMGKWRWMTGALVFGLFLAIAGTANAGRVPMTRTEGQKSSGSRIDITVPYTTNGNTAFGVAQGVAPRIYASPIVDDPGHPQSRPVYNLPSWG